MDGGPWSPTRWALQGARTPPRCPAMSLSTPSVSSLPLPPPGHVRGSRLLAAGGHPLAAEGGHTPGWMLGRPGTAHSKGRCPPRALSPGAPALGPQPCPPAALAPGRAALLPRSCPGPRPPAAPPAQARRSHAPSAPPEWNLRCPSARPSHAHAHAARRRTARAARAAWARGRSQGGSRARIPACAASRPAPCPGPGKAVPAGDGPGP